MSTATDRQPSKPPRRKPAWLISCAVHVGVAALAIAAMQRAPAGGTNKSGDDGGIVLQRRSTQNNDRSADAHVTQAVYATTEQPFPPALLVADPETPPPQTNQSP